MILSVFFLASAFICGVTTTDNTDKQEPIRNVHLDSLEEWPRLPDSGLDRDAEDWATVNLNDSDWTPAEFRENSEDEDNSSAEVEKRQRQTSKFDPGLKYLGLGKRGKSRSQFDPGMKFMGLGKRGPGSGRPKYDPGMNFMGLGKREPTRSKFDPGMKFMGLGKRESTRPKFDPGMRFMGLGKRESTRPKFDPGMRFMGLGKRELGRPKYDPGMKFMGLGKRGSERPKFDPGMNFMGLGKRETGRPKYDPGMRFMGLGKREPGRPKYDPGMKFMGLGKKAGGGGGRAKFDPGMNFMGLGKRASDFTKYDSGIGLEKRSIGDDSELLGDSDFDKREYLRPKYDPGWKFIGLGKRSVGYQNSDANNYLNAETVEALHDIYNPYLGVLALRNLSNFFRHIHNELQAMNDPSNAASEENLTEEKGSVPVASDGMTSTLYIRSRKPARFSGKVVRPLFDPGWQLTGLGK